MWQFRRTQLPIVDDHELARAGLQRILAGEKDLEVVGEARNGQEAVGLCRYLQPNLVLMDVRMPELDGLAATRAIKQQDPHIAVIIITMYENPDYLYQALKAGAAGYLLKDASKREVIMAIRRVLQGEALLQRGLATQLLQRLATERSPRSEGELEESLTARGVEVLRLLAQGQTNPEIAYKLRISLATVKVHVGHIIAKLGASDRTQAALRAVELGLLAVVAEHTLVPA
jgi:DNA-binding NarL/FixJ family response regulator